MQSARRGPELWSTAAYPLFATHQNRARGRVHRRPFGRCPTSHDGNTRAFWNIGVPAQYKSITHPQRTASYISFQIRRTKTPNMQWSIGDRRAYVDHSIIHQHFKDPLRDGDTFRPIARARVDPRFESVGTGHGIQIQSRGYGEQVDLIDGRGHLANSSPPSNAQEQNPAPPRSDFAKSKDPKAIALCILDFSRDHSSEWLSTLQPVWPLFQIP